MPVVDADPHLSERAQARQDASADPGAVFALGRREDLDSHVFDGQTLDFVQQSVAEAFCEGCAAAEDDVAVQGLAQVEVSAADGVNNNLVNARVFEAYYLRVEEDLWGAKPLGANLWSN